MADYNNQMHGMMQTSYGDEKWNKQRELNSGMSIVPQAPDQLTNKLSNVFGGE